MQPTTGDTGNGKNKLFNDSKLGLIVAGLGFAAFDAVLDTVIEQVSTVDVSASDSWWSSIASAAVATGLGLLTAFKAKRNKNRA